MSTQTLAEQRAEEQQLAADKNERAERAAPGFPQAGEVWHCLRTGTMFGGRVLCRGDTFSPTEEQISSTVDRTGHSPLSQWGTPGSSIQPGEFPADEPVLIWGSVDWELSRAEAMDRAKRSPDPDAGFRDVLAKFGPSKPTSTTWDYPSRDSASNSKWSR